MIERLAIAATWTGVALVALIVLGFLLKLLTLAWSWAF